MPGSEPTPLIQAFEAAAKKQNADTFPNRAIAIANRPKSWSPDSVESAVLLPKQHSQSLEHLPPECNERVKLKNNMRLPCKNGQNYSVSQNQVFHLEESNVMNQCMSNVKLIVNELESNVKRRSETKCSNSESSLNGTTRVVTKPPISSSATVCDKTSPFGSLKRSESNRSSRTDFEPASEKYSPVMKSRSLDVANLMTSSSSSIATTAINAPTATTTVAAAATASMTINTKPPFGTHNQRHSHHFEELAPFPLLPTTTTTATTPSPPSSAAATVANQNASPAAWQRRSFNSPITNTGTLNNNNNNNNSNNKNNNNCNNSTTNSSSRSGSTSSSNSSSSSSSNVSLSSMSSDLINDLCKSGTKNVKNLRNAYSLKSTNQNNNHHSTKSSSVELVVPSLFSVDKRNLINDSDTESSFVNMTIARFADQFSKDIMSRIKKRCKSDGMLYESDLLATVNKRFSSSSPTQYSNEKSLNNRPVITYWNNRFTSNKNSPQLKCGKRVKNRSLCRTVENLKLNFESKSETESTAQNIGIAKEAKRGKSLPSSPVASVYANNITSALHPSTESSTTPTLKLNYDKLGCEEINVKGLVERINATTNTTTTTTPNPTPSPNVMARFKRHTIHQSPHHNNQLHHHHHHHQHLHHNAIHPKPPPIPHASIVVATSKPANILLSKPLQQNNQSFARLKEHFNSASAYNTMWAHTHPPENIYYYDYTIQSNKQIQYVMKDDKKNASKIGEKIQNTFCFLIYNKKKRKNKTIQRSNHLFYSSHFWIRFNLQFHRNFSLFYVFFCLYFSLCK